LPARVPPPRHLTQEGQVVRPAGKIPAAAQQQRLHHYTLEMPVRRLGVTVLVPRRRVGLLHHQLVMGHQLLIPLREFTFVRQVVHCRAEPIAAMPLGHATQLPQGILQAVAQTLETLRETDRHRLPVRVGQHAVIHQVVEGLARNGHAQVVHGREVRGTQPAGDMHLREVDLLGRPRSRPPLLHPPLQRAQLSLLEPTRIACLQPLEKRLGLQRRYGFQIGCHFRPHAIERIGPRTPVTRSVLLAWQLAHVSVPPCRFAIHAGLERRRRQGLTRFQEPKQMPHLTIHDLGHRKLQLPGLASVYIRHFQTAALLGRSNCRWGEVVVAAGEE